MKKAKNISKSITRAVRDLVILFKNNNWDQKRKATSKDKYFNCHQLEHFSRDCSISNKQYPNNRSHIPNFQSQNTNKRGNKEEYKRRRNHNNSCIPNQANQATKDYNNSDPEPLSLGPDTTVFMIKIEQFQQFLSSNTWFLNLCALWHLCNNCTFFTTLKVKSINFVIATGQVIRMKENGTLSISLTNGNTIKLQNVILALDYDSNLISFGQL